MRLNYQCLFKIVERPSNGYVESIEIRNNLPYLVFSSPGWISAEQLRTLHRNLGHPTVKKQMQVLENAGIGQLSRKVRRKLKEIVEYCKPC